MFFFLALTAVIAYAFNSTFMAPLARRMSGLEASTWRGLALGLSMIPILFFVPHQAWSHISPKFLPWAALLWVITTAANSLVFLGQKHLPVGINLALCIGVATLLSTAIGVAVFHDAFTQAQIALGVLMLAEAVALGVVSSRGVKTQGTALLGVFYSALGGAFMGLAYGLVGYLSRDSSPLLVGYVWETGTGLVGLLVLLALRLRHEPAPKNRPFIKVSFWKILLASSPTVVGTACYALATTSGPLGLAGAILATMGAFAALFSFFFLKERLTWPQGALVGIMVATLAGLKLVV